MVIILKMLIIMAKLTIKDSGNDTVFGSFGADFVHGIPVSLFFLFLSIYFNFHRNICFPTTKKINELYMICSRIYFFQDDRTITVSNELYSPNFLYGNEGKDNIVGKLSLCCVCIACIVHFYQICTRQM